MSHKISEVRTATLRHLFFIIWLNSTIYTHWLTDLSVNQWNPYSWSVFASIEVSFLQFMPRHIWAASVVMLTNTHKTFGQAMQNTLCLMQYSSQIKMLASEVMWFAMHPTWFSQSPLISCLWVAWQLHRSAGWCKLLAVSTRQQKI